MLSTKAVLSSLWLLPSSKNLRFEVARFWNKETYKIVNDEKSYNQGHNILRLLMFDQIFLSPQVKQSVFISNKHGMRELT